MWWGWAVRRCGFGGSAAGIVVTLRDRVGRVPTAARADGADVPGRAGAARLPRVMIQVLTSSPSPGECLDRARVFIMAHRPYPLPPSCRGGSSPAGAPTARHT